jgi:CubicO group peptidase (beta-lactamase class C family)
VWPEFTAADKASITPRPLLSHKGGLVWWPDYARTMSLDEPETFSRYAEITAALAAAPPI